MNLLRSLFFAGVCGTANLVSAENYPGVEDIRQFIDGDSTLWPRFEQCAEEHASCNLIAGHVSLKSNELDRAEYHFLSALQKGDDAAPWAMILLNIERNRPIEIFAWSQLALAMLSANEAERIESNRNNWSFIQLAQAARDFSDEQWTLGEQRSQELIDHWLPALQTDSDGEVQECTCRHHVPIYQHPPRYPRKLANAGQPGWSLIEFAVDEQGKVVDEIVILYSDERFAQSSTRAIRRWKFEPVEMTEHNQTCITEQRYRQTINFQMER